jgi:hypothetical protein
MSVEVTTADELDADRWDRLVAQSPAGTPFHRRAAVDVLAEHANADLHALVGYKGQEPVGVFPVFEKSKGPVSTAFSPPPDLKVSYLGPAPCNLAKLKARKRERRHRRFVEGCLDYLEREVGPRYVHVRVDPDYPDPRPFDWNDFEVTPRYTYVVDLDRDEDDLFAAFSSDARQNVRAADDAAVEVSEGGRAVVDRILDQVAARHREQDKTYLVTPEFVGDLYDRLPDGVVRPYAVRVDGEFAGGMVTLESEDTVYRWQGGAKPDADLPVNDALDWRIMSDAVERGKTGYDLVGANNPRLCRYKAKFAPDLRVYHSFQRGTRGMNVASKVYSRIRE